MKGHFSNSEFVLLRSKRKMSEISKINEVQKAIFRVTK